MRLATFNILHGRSMHDGTVEAARLAESVKRLDADVLALQEVDLDQPRSAMADLTAIAAEAMGASSHRFVAAISGTPGATWMAATGSEQPGTAAYGIALLSRFPVHDWQVVRLPRIPFRFPLYLPGPRRIVIVNDEPRAAVIARMDSPLGPLTIASTHLSFVPGWGSFQLRRLSRDLQAFDGPRVLMGDLNMRPRTARRGTRFRSLADAATFPAGKPVRQLDHILTDDRTLTADRFAAPLLAISDHRALVVDVGR